MAELYFKRLIEKRGCADKFVVDSFGTSDEEEGNGIYPPAARELNRHGITGTHVAKKITPRDIAALDYILVADGKNLARLFNISSSADGKAYRLCDFTINPRDVIDPWYSRNFEQAYIDIADGCDGFLKYLEDKSII